MEASTIKKLTFLFWTGVAGVSVCLAMSVYTVVTHKPGPNEIQTQTIPQSIPIPAEAPR